MANRDRLIPMAYFQDLSEARKSLRENALLSLETQLELLHFLGSPQAEETYIEFTNFYGYKKLVNHADKERLGLYLLDSVTDVVKNAPTYFVSRDMTEMVSQASEDLARFADEGLSPVDLPSATGFLVFDHPVLVHAEGYGDKDGSQPKGLPLAGFAWRTSVVGGAPNDGGGMEPGVEYFLFLWPEGMGWLGDMPEKADQIRAEWGPFPIYDFSGWKYGKGWSRAAAFDQEGDQDEEGRLVVAPVVDVTRRILLTTFKMLNEKITVLESERPYRALGRRAQRAMPNPGDVVVVRLRKEYNPKHKYEAEHGADDVDNDEPWYTHRFMVKGHWKRQHYGVVRSERKIFWIAPYIKGPEDRPFILKDRVYSLEQ